MKTHTIYIFTFLLSCNAAKPDRSSDIDRKKDSLLLQSYITINKEQKILDSIFNAYWQSLSIKEYQRNHLKIRPDLGLVLPQLIDECAEVTNELIEKYEEVSDYDTVYTRILNQLSKENIYVEDTVLSIIYSNLEQWDSRNIGIPNTKSFLHLYYAQLRVRMLEVMRKQDLGNIGLESLLLNAQKEYEMVYDSAYYFD